MSYNVVIQSDKYVGTTSTTTSRQYAFDWTPFEEGAYELTFSMIAQRQDDPNNISLYNDIVVELPDIGAQFQSFNAGSKIASQSSNIIGHTVSNSSVADVTQGPAQSCYSCGIGDNAPIKILSKPSSNIFTVRLFNLNAFGVLTPPTNVTGYVLILNFKRC